MRVLTDPNELESLFLPEPALLELRQQLAIPGHNPQELCTLWRDLPARLIYFNEVDMLGVIVQRLGDEALTLTPEDLNLALDEVKIAIDHNLDIREYIDMGLDAWEIVRKL